MPTEETSSPKFRLYIAASLDGFIATPDGKVDWLDRFKGDYGYDEFLAEIATVVLGRKTYDVIKAMGQWPYKGKRAYVLSTNQISTAHGEAKRADSAGKLIPRLRMLDGGDVWVVGGGLTQRAFLDAGAVDRLDLFVMPIVLGDGVRLFPGKTTGIELPLEETYTFPDGVVRLTYAKQTML